MKPPRKSIPHDSAIGHVTGEAQYIDDLPPTAREVAVDFVGSPVARGTLLSIDASAALAHPGVLAVYTRQDLPGHNLWGAIIPDEPLLVEKELRYVGQPIAIIAAETREVARTARKLVKLEYTEEEPVLSIEQAIERGDYIGARRRIARGDAARAFANTPHKLSGELRVAGQEQFYFESQAALAIPEEFGAITVHSSTQSPTEVQHVVAEALGLHMHQVICVCKRMGGGFGGKETQAVIPAVMAALVAQKLRRPARVVYTKDDDMKFTGKRHEYRARWSAAFDDNGLIDGARFEFHSNGGAFADLSTSVLERTMLHAENAYYIPNIEIEAQACRTNLPPNTAFRGFGGPQGFACIENMMEEIARHLGKDPLEIRRVNLYGEAPRNVAPYGQIILDHKLPEIFATLERTSEYAARRRAVDAFNATSVTHLRGLSLTGLKFGISFTASFLNQGNALVNVYMDGTVQVSTGATEMGQGVNTKIRQIVADEFGIPVSNVTVMTTSTEKNINTSPTAASAGTDLNGAAARNACEEIKGRMNALAARLLSDADDGISPSPGHILYTNGHVLDSRRPERSIPFAEFCKRCRLERIDIGARGFFATPGVEFNRETGRGNPFFYYTTGAAVAEVLIDRFTGELSIERIDLLMDIGRAINEAIDRGQVIGGFVQGMGWCTTELLVYNEKGELLSHSPTTYKIPAITDVPKIFNVAFVETDGEPRNIRGSKAVGEPPLLLSLCTWTAVKDALRSLAGRETAINLRLPATGEEILRVIDEIEGAKHSKHATNGNGAAVRRSTAPVG